MENLYGLAKRMQGVESSPTVRLNTLAKSMQAKGEDIVNLTAGELDFPTDEKIVRAANDALKKGFTKYTPTHGIPELRKKVAEWFGHNWNLSYGEKQITVTCGTKQGIFNFLLAVLNEGDEVLIPAPFWVSYPEMVKLAGGKPIIVPSSFAQGFQLNISGVEKAINKKTRILILNSPNNPSGAIYSKQDLQKLAKILEGTKILVVSDEIYGDLYFGERPVPFAAISQDAFARTVTFNGLAKSHAMTGWRIGFAAGSEALIEAMGIIQSQSVTNITSFVQYAALTALELNPADQYRLLLKDRRDFVVKSLQKIPQCKIHQPAGAFYCFPDLSAYFGKSTSTGKKITDSNTLAEYLLLDAKVALIPGAPFGDNHCIRISYSTNLENLQKAMERTKLALQSISA